MDEALVVLVRGIISFFTLLIFTRILGKQQIGQITFFDYILGITIGSFAASLTVDLGSAAWPHWVGLLTWIVLGVIMQFISLKFHGIAEYINDKPIIVIQDGKIIMDNLKITRFTLCELLSQLRIKGIFEVDKIKYAVIEANGQLSIIGYEQFFDLIGTLGIPKEEINPDNLIIFNGIMINENILGNKLNEAWVCDVLVNLGYNNTSEVCFAYLNKSKNLNVIGYSLK